MQYDLVTLLFMLSGIFAYINYKYLKMPTTIGIMVVGLVVSLSLIFIDPFIPLPTDRIMLLLSQFNFEESVMHIFLGPLLFAGSLQMDIRDLVHEKLIISLLATLGVFLSALFIGVVTYLLLQVLGIEIHILYALAFGALISPTDPVVVFGVMKKEKIDKQTHMTIVGESLFNDGMAIVLFTVFTKLIDQGGASSDYLETFQTSLLLLVKQLFGGGGIGIILGLIGAHFIRQVKSNGHVQILLSLGLVSAGYQFAHLLETSGPIAVVVVGLIIGHYIRKDIPKGLGIGGLEEEHEDIPLFSFWEILDEFLNSFLFILVGLQILSLHFSFPSILAGVLAIIIALFGRFMAISVCLQTIRPLKKTFPPYFKKILTWAGLRGGLSMAMALMLAHSSRDEKLIQIDTILVMTYIVVVFSILVQGLSIGPVLKKLEKNS